MSEGRKMWESQLKQRQQIHLSSTFLLFRPSTDWKTPTRTGEGEIFRKSTDLNANLFPRLPHRYT